jgi:hypothetical protein
VFAITGFQELGEGRLEAIYVAEDRDGGLRPAGQVRFGFTGKGLWGKLDRLRADPVRKGIIPVRLELHPRSNTSVATRAGSSATA